MTKTWRIWGALGCMAVFAVFAAVCWLEGRTGISVLMLVIGAGFALIFAIASDNTVKWIGSLW